MTLHDPADDVAWQSLLRRNTPSPPMDEVEWDALHARITDRAAPLIGRRSPSWWQLLSDSVPYRPRVLAAAAVVTLAIAGVLMPERPVSPAATLEFRTIEEELAGDLINGPVPMLAAGASGDDVLDFLLFYDMEEQ